MPDNDSTDEGKSSSSIQRGAEQLLEAGDFEEAARIFEDLAERSQGAQRCSLLHRAASALWKAGDYGRAAEVYQQAAVCRQKQGDRAGEARELLGLGASLHGLGRMARAYQVMHEALEAAEEVEDLRCVVDATNWLGIVSRSQEDYALAIEHHRRALRLSRRSEDDDREANSLNSLALAHHHLGDLEQALEKFRMALELRRRIGDDWGSADTLNNLGMTLKDLGRLEEALESYSEALELRRAVGGASRLANVLNNTGNLLLRMDRPQEAILRHKEALRIRRGISHAMGVASSLLNLGEAWAAFGRHEWSLLCLRASLTLQEGMEVLDLRVETLSMLSEVMRECGSLEASLDAAGQALELSRRHYAERERLKLAQARALLETEHQAREARTLRRKNARLRELSDMLASKKEQLQLILDYVPALIVFTDAEGRIARLNSYAARLMGALPRDLVGREYDPLFGSLGLHTGDMASSVMAEGRPMLELERKARLEDTDRHFLMNLLPYSDSEGGVNGVVVFAVDVTAERLAEEKRSEFLAYRERSRRLESLSHLAGTIAHDFNNLLLGIMGNAELASMKLPESPASKNLRIVLESAQKAAELCRQMLAFSGKGKFVTQRVDITSAMEEILDSEDFPLHGIGFEGGEGLPPVELDPAQLRQALENLVDEARRRGVSSKSMAFRTGICYATNGGDGEMGVYAELYCRGLIMDREQARTMLEPFLDDDATTVGLGIAAVSGIVRSHGGSVEVDVDRPGGTAIRLCFPSCMQAASAVGEPSAVFSQFERGSVLVVDDEATVRQTAREMIESLGYTAQTCSGGREALELLASGDSGVSCVLLDLTMPGLGGQEVLEAICREHPGLQVILSSGFSSDSAADAAGNPCYSGFLHKPYSSSELEQMLRAVMS